MNQLGDSQLEKMYNTHNKWGGILLLKNTVN
ncbi:MAG: hypothetical protein K0S23_1240 [Fluviicola sp.]|jgi:hypothetical protein|nr:hypothetical protein [Fluviicola sp.]